MADAINIIIDKSDPPHSQFVKIETDDGRSILIGERIEYQGLTKIRITADDIKNIFPKSKEGTSQFKIEDIIIIGKYPPKATEDEKNKLLERLTMIQQKLTEALSEITK